MKKEYKICCKKCGNSYDIITTQYKYNKGDYKKFCSRSCANSRNWTDVEKKKISISCSNSDKVKIANSVITEKRKRAFDDGRNKRKTSKSNEFICKHCGKIGFDKKKRNKKYHKECWLKISGGIRKGSSRGKSGYYKGYWCDSSYELAFLIYCLEHNRIIERNKTGFNYIYFDKNHTYFPDFRVDGSLVEIKNYRSKLTEAKLKSVNEKIEIFYKDTMKPYLDYVKIKYGKNFINLYSSN